MVKLARVFAPPGGQSRLRQRIKADKRMGREKRITPSI
jgi:hypothetical protein